MATAVLVAAALAAGSSACRERTDRPPDVILIVMDTVRADHLGLYGYDRPTSPGLDAASQNAIVYEAAVATAPMTMPSMAALLTGSFGDRVGVSSHSRRDRLAESAPTLAESAREAGYRTVAVVANPWLARTESGFARGFDRFLTPRALATGSRERLRADILTDAALAAVAEDDSKPLLLWVHYIDAHMPYTPPAVDAAALGNETATSAIVERFSAPRADPQDIYFAPSLAAADVAATVSLYDGAIRFVDRQISRLRSALTHRSRPTLTVITSDHGESLGDHGLYFAHDFTLYEELLHVPLVLEPPGGGGKRVATPVSLLDVFPTVCALTPIGCPDGLDGLPLPLRNTRDAAQETRILHAAGPPKRARYARDPWILSPGFAGRWTMARRGSIKLVHIPTPNGERLRAFDLALDAEEESDVFDAARHADLHTALDRWRLDMAASRVGSRGRAEPFDATTREELRELGYMD